MEDFKHRNWLERREFDALQWHIEQNREMLADYVNDRRKMLKERAKVNESIAKGILADISTKATKKLKKPVESK